MLTDIGTEELAHMEMIAGLVYKLVDGASPEDFKAAGWEGQFVQHNHGLFWTDANGVPLYRLLRQGHAKVPVGAGGERMCQSKHRWMGHKMKKQGKRKTAAVAAVFAFVGTCGMVDVDGPGIFAKGGRRTAKGGFFVAGGEYRQ